MRRIAGVVRHRVRRALGLDHELAALGRGQADLNRGYERDITRVWELFDEHQGRISQLERRVQVATVMAWIEQASVAEERLISVILPTRGRAGILPRAIESVIRQSYSRWELVVCADGDDDARTTEAVVRAFDEPRIRLVPGAHGGAGAARNRGLDVAEGELITYLDDDNRMHPNWLKSVAWAFEQRPGTEVLHGGIAIDDTARQLGEPGAAMPSAWLEQYDRDGLIEANVADASAIAHRAGLPEARWDEELVTMGDWELFLRLTAARDPLTLPVIACFYYTDVAERLSSLGPQLERDRERVVSRGRATRRPG